MSEWATERVSERFVPAAGVPALTRFYDLAIDLFSGERLLRRAMVEDVAAAVAGIEDARILEIGCGTGSLTIAIVRAIPGATVVGVDIDPKALAIATSKAGSERVDWRQGSATTLPVSEASFDVVAISLVMHHLMPRQQPTALTQALQALKPGGSLLVLDFGLPRSRLGRAGSKLLALVDGRENTGPIFRGELPGMIDAAGFTDRRLLDRFNTPAGTIERYTAVRAGRDPAVR